MSVDFSSIEGGSVASFLSGDGALSTDAPVETPAEQAPAAGADTHQVETPAPVAADATIETPETETKTEEGTEESSEKSDSPDAQVKAEELKGPKALRDAYDSLKAEVAPLEPYKDFMKTVVEQEISPVMLQEGKALLDSFLSLEEGEEIDAAKAQPFLSNLYQLSPTAFQRAMLSLIDDNKDFVAKRLGMESKPEANASAEVDEEIPVPEFDPVSGEPLSEDVRNLIRAANERMKSFNEKEKERTESERAALAAQAEKQAEEEAARIDASITSYRNDRLKVIDSTIEKNLGLKDLPTDKPELKADKAMARELIKQAAVSSFGADPKASKFYKDAIDKIAEGKTKLADGLAFNIEREMGAHAEKVAEFVSKLLAKAYQAEKAQVQKAATGDRPEVSENGASASTAAVDTSNMAPFSAESIAARLANLEASGRLPRR